MMLAMSEVRRRQDWLFITDVEEIVILYGLHYQPFPEEK